MDSAESTLEAMLQEVPSEVVPEPTKSCFGSDCAYQHDGDGDGGDNDDDDNGSEGKTQEDKTWKRLSAELEPDRKTENGHGQDDTESEDQLLNALESKKACIQNQSTAEDTKSEPHAILPKNPADVEWLMRFDELAAYRGENGHCNVKTRKNRSLYNWVLSQRRLFESRNLDEDRKRKLDSIGVDWTKKPLKELLEEKWNKKFDELAAFHKKNGHCLVSKKDGKGLCSWVSKQGRVGLENLREHRRRRLESIGFEWSTGERRKKALEAIWQERFDELSAYHEVNGHCDVTLYENLSLYNWVLDQRRLFKSRNLDEDRKRNWARLGLTGGRSL